MNKKDLLKKIKENNEKLVNVLREQLMYDIETATKCLTNFGLREVLEDSKRELEVEERILKEIKSRWKEEFAKNEESE